MINEKKNAQAFKNVKRGLYARIAENERKNKMIFLGIAACVLVLATLLLLGASFMETSMGKYTYVYGEYKQKISKEQATDGKITLIDMNALADYCKFTKDSIGSKMTYRVNGTEVIFEGSKNIALVNGIKVEMPCAARVKNGYCLVPLSTVQEILLGVDIESSKSTMSVSLNGMNVYIMVSNPKIEYSTDVSEYLDAINSKGGIYSILVNKQNEIAADFEPDDLVEIPADYSRDDKTIELERTTLLALMAMLNDMEAEGISDIHVQSSYRTHNYQTILYNTYIDNEMSHGLSREEAIIAVDKYSAKPEYSEHRTGLCVDFSTKSIYNDVSEKFETTDAFPWLVENSWKYGFILRYPEDKVAITGYQYESWHYRFVGVEVASVIYQTGLCYEEYLEYFAEGN